MVSWWRWYNHWRSRHKRDLCIVAYPTIGGTYNATISVTETNTLSGCTDTDILTVAVRYQPIAQTITRVSPLGPVSQACNNDVINYSVNNNPGSTFAWTVTGGNILSGGATASATIQWTTVGNNVSRL